MMETKIQTGIKTITLAKDPLPVKKDIDDGKNKDGNQEGQIKLVFKIKAFHLTGQL
jgi:hypothetical protein